MKKLVFISRLHTWIFFGSHQFENFSHHFSKFIMRALQCHLFNTVVINTSLFSLEKINCLRFSYFYFPLSLNNNLGAHYVIAKPYFSPLWTRIEGVLSEWKNIKMKGYLLNFLLAAPLSLKESSNKKNKGIGLRLEKIA